VFGAPQTGYYAIVAVNWNDDDAHSLTIDFVKIGAALSSDQECSVYDLWSGNFLGNFTGIYFEGRPIEPHDNVALKIVCKKEYQKMSL
jgi:Alpha galactosidase C-terminal beta sandwich domain